MRRAVVIKTAGDEAIGSAIVNGMMQPLTSEELDVVRAELSRVREENARLGVRKVRDAKTFRNKINRSKRKYKVREPNRVSQVLLVTWAITWLTIKACYEYLAALNREG